MGEFTGASSSLSGHYERQQRLSLKATQAKNQRLVHKFDITKSSIDREQRKEMKQLEKTRKDVLNFLNDIHVSTGSSIKKTEIRVPKHRAKIHMNNWIAREASKDNLSDVIDEAATFNDTYSGQARTEEDAERTAFSIPTNSGQEFDFTCEGSEWTPRDARNDETIECIQEYEDEESAGGTRTKKWVQVQTQRIASTQSRDLPVEEVQIKPVRSMTLPNIGRDSRLSHYQQSQQRRHSEDAGYCSSKSQVGRRVSTYARANPRTSGPCNDRFRKRRNFALEQAEEQRSLQYRLMEAAKRKEILAKASQEAQQDVEETMLILRDDKWTEHLSLVKSRRAQTLRKDAVSVWSQKDNDEESSDSRSTVSGQAVRLLRRASLPSVTIPAQNRQRTIDKKTSQN